MKKLIYILVAVISLASCIKEDKPTINEILGSSALADTTIINVGYGTNSMQKYDIYLPAGRDLNTPIILMIHGGAWKAGQKEELNAYIALIKKKWSNVAIVNMNYRLASNANNIHHNEIMDDIKNTIGDIIAQQNKYKISQKMGIVGASAGAQLAMIYAYKQNDFKNIGCVASIFGPTIIADWEWYNTTNIWLGGKVGDILTEYVGQTWNETIYKNVSPYWNISPSSQPTIIFHGSVDPIVPVYQSQWMNAKLGSLNVIHEYHEYFAFHSFDNAQADDVTSKMVNFFKANLK